jgi:hypothetical protein
MNPISALTGAALRTYHGLVTSPLSLNPDRRNERGHVRGKIVLRIL